VDGSRRDVSLAPIKEPYDHSDHLRDVLCRAANDLRPLNVQLSGVVEERVLVLSGDLPDRETLARGALLHLVLALIGIGLKMAYICNVHNMLEIVAVEEHRASQNVVENVRA